VVVVLAEGLGWVSRVFSGQWEVLLFVFRVPIDCCFLGMWLACFCNGGLVDAIFCGGINDRSSL